MRVKQTVETKFNTMYIGWSNIQFTDSNDNIVQIDVTEDNLLEIGKTIVKKCDKIREERQPQEEESTLQR